MQDRIGAIPLQMSAGRNDTDRKNFKTLNTMKLSRIFAAAAILASSILSATSCVNDAYDLEKVDTEMTLVPGISFPVEGKIKLPMSKGVLTKSTDEGCEYDFTVTAKESGINFVSFKNKMGAYARHFQVKAEIVNNTEYDMYGVVDIYGGDVKVDMDEVAASRSKKQVVADVYCDGSLDEIEKAVFHIMVVNGREDLYSTQMPDVQINVKEIVLVDGVTLNLGNKSFDARDLR